MLTVKSISALPYRQMIIPGTTYESENGHRITVYHYNDDAQGYTCVDEIEDVSFHIAPRTLTHLFDADNYVPVNPTEDSEMIGPWMTYKRPDGEQIMVTEYDPATRHVTYLDTAKGVGAGTETTDIDEFRALLDREDCTLIKTSP